MGAGASRFSAVARNFDLIAGSGMRSGQSHNDISGAHRALFNNQRLNTVQHKLKGELQMSIITAHHVVMTLKHIMWVGPTYW